MRSILLCIFALLLVPYGAYADADVIVTGTLGTDLDFNGMAPESNGGKSAGKSGALPGNKTDEVDCKIVAMKNGQFLVCENQGNVFVKKVVSANNN